MQAQEARFHRQASRLEHPQILARLKPANIQFGKGLLSPLIPYWCTDRKAGKRPINAKAESLSQLPMFKDAYALRRCILPIDGFFEWRALKGSRAKQPYAVAMKDGSPFGLAGSGENWKNPTTGEWERTFAITGPLQ